MNNGLDWTASTGNPFGELGNVAKISFLNSKYYAFGDDGEDKLIYTSDNGLSWTEETIPVSVGATSQLEDVIIKGGEYYTVGAINDAGGYLFGTQSGDNIAWSRGTDSIFTTVTNFRTIDKQKNGPFVIGGVVGSGNHSLIFSDTGNSDSWDPVDNNPFGEDSIVEKVLYS